MELKPILGLLIASAIPVVMFALWSEYFRGGLDTKGSEESESTEETIADHTLRIRIAGLLSTLLQLFVFLVTTPVRQESSSASVAGLFIVLFALIFQRSLQYRLEREILPGSDERQSNPDSYRSPPSTFFWALAGTALYMGILFGTVFSSAVAVAAFRLNGSAAIAVIGLGALTGFTLAMGSNFAFSSWFLKRMVPSEPLSDAKVIAVLEKIFLESGVQAPEFRRISIDSVRSANAWVTGFPTFTGPLRPVLWFTPALLAELESPEQQLEFEAVVKHEVAHMKLHHLSQRFRLAWICSLTVFSSLALSMALNIFFRSQSIGSALPLLTMAASIGLVVFSFRKLQRQLQKQELEADRYSVVGLGASAASLISALKRIDTWNSRLTASSSVGLTQENTSHPAVQDRIAALEFLAAKERVENQDSIKKAA
ncbi:MAG: M48 family metalloprotease [Bdellovibrionales bacterium]|nr:M48 family metalloprotease [Bdellovibrionales bacterium]